METLLEMTRPASIARSLALACSCALGLAACNFEVPSSSYLVKTTMITVLFEVVELGPLHPERVGVPSEVPIAEPLPHDRVAFEAFVVDETGERVPTSELDSLWFQCGVVDCGQAAIPADSELFDRDCDDLEADGFEWTMDAVCRLGGGDGRFEFVVPELDQLLAEFRVAQYYGVVAWGGRSAESCWSTRRAANGSLENCGFIQRSVKVGPSWWMLVYAESIGLQSPIPIVQIPAGVFYQAANRVPVVRFPVSVGGEVIGTWPEQATFEVEAGDRIEITAEYDEVSQFLQTYFVASVPTGPPGMLSFLWKATSELLGERPFTSNAIVLVEFDADADVPAPLSWEFVVDPYADAGTSRILFYYFDDRYGEGVATLEFEVRG